MTGRERYRPMRKRRWLAVGLVLVLGWQVQLVAQGPEEHPLPQLSAWHRAGQTFITWSEVGGPEVTYNLYRSGAPIATADLNKFLDYLLHERGVPCSPKSYARRVTTLKVLFKWLHKSGVLASDPAAPVIQFR